MTKTLEELLKLPPAERAEIAVTLWDSVAESEGADVLPLSAELKAELDRRLALRVSAFGGAMAMRTMSRSSTTTRSVYGAP